MQPGGLEAGVVALYNRRATSAGKKPNMDFTFSMDLGGNRRGDQDCKFIVFCSFVPATAEMIRFGKGLPPVVNLTENFPARTRWSDQTLCGKGIPPEGVQASGDTFLVKNNPIRTTTSL